MTPANDNRPAAFDARIAAYLPGLRKLARRYTKTHEQANDLVTDTVIYALEKWQNFRPRTGADRKSDGFWAWLVWQMRGVVQNASVKTANRRRVATFVALDDAPALRVAPNQHDYAELSQTIARLSGTRSGGVLLRRAMGDKLGDVANDLGVSRERVRQLEVAARHELRVAA